MAVSFRAELVRVYAATPVAKIGESFEYQKLLELYGNDSRFRTERDQVEKAKAYVEGFLQPSKTQAEEVREALRLLIKERRGAHLRDLYRELIVAGYAPSWTKLQQEYFGAAWSKITARYDFFLSFTTRYEPVPGDNPVNTNYRYFIKSVLSKQEIKAADQKKTNLLALAVLRLLTKAPSVPFFFPHIQYDNSNTAEKLKQACSDSLVLVQLIRNIMFVTPEGGRQNWCLYEYQTVYDALGTDDERNHRILFIVAENEKSLIDPLLVPGSYNAWHTYIAERDPPYLPEMDTYDSQRIAQAKKLLTQKIRPLLEDPLRRLVEGVPA